MNIELYLYAKYDKAALDILKLLDENNIQFSVYTFGENDSLDMISNRVGEKIRRLPVVMVEGKRVGRYYDLIEYLVNEGIINYQGKSYG
jgi:glutaredoxin|tara:strand:+ start:160 stop:426 length:267 start_codon:yes stop_codon:yes gene_type:complete